MTQPLHIIAITLFPEMFPGPLGYSLVGTALKENRWKLSTIALRDFGLGKHRQVDDTPYGGGAGLVLRADVVGAAIDAALELEPTAQLVYLTPRGTPFAQRQATQWSGIESDTPPRPLIFLCGRFEAIDDRVIQKHQPIEISLGDFVMTGGEIAAMAMIDSCIRLLPGVIGESHSLKEESFGLDENYACLLEHPHYSKPPVWEGQPVPDVLLSGHHEQIRRWRLEQSERLTQDRRPDIWQAYQARNEK